MAKHTVWSHELGDIENWRESWEDGDGLSERELYERAQQLNADYLEDERLNLNIELSAQIIAIVDLGRWNGRFPGYKYVGCNIADCLYSDCDLNEWYVDELGDFRLTATHHDGTNFILYRKLKDNLSDTQIENLEALILNGKLTRYHINRYTERIGPYIADVYGFKVPRHSKTA